MGKKRERSSNEKNGIIKKGLNKKKGIMKRNKEYSLKEISNIHVYPEKVILLWKPALYQYGGHPCPPLQK